MTSGGSRPDVSIVTSGHDVADARLHRVCGALVRRGLAVEVLGLGHRDDAPAGVVAVRTRERPGPAGRAALALRYAAEADGAVVVALDPDSLLACRVVAGVRRELRVVADVHEDYGALLADRAWATGVRARVGRLLVRLAVAAARTSDLTAVADEHLPPLSARQRMVVRNHPDVQVLPETGEPTGPPRALYVGDVRESRGLWDMVEAVARADGWHLDIVGPVGRADRARLDARLAASDLGGRVRVHGRLVPQRAWHLATGASCGLALLRDTAAFRAALPTKVLEYLACGLPVIVTDLPRQAELVSSTGAGAVVSAAPGRVVDETAAVLAAWSAAPVELAAARASAVGVGLRMREDDPYAELAAAVAALVPHSAER